jgi:hypothetical protein
MRTCKQLLYYSDKDIVIEDDDLYSWIKLLCSHGVSFFIIINKKENKAYKLCTDEEQAEKLCRNLNKQMDCNDFIYDYIHNSK